MPVKYMSMVVSIMVFLVSITSDALSQTYERLHAGGAWTTDLNTESDGSFSCESWSRTGDSILHYVQHGRGMSYLLVTKPGWGAPEEGVTEVLSVEIPGRGKWSLISAMMGDLILINSDAQQRDFQRVLSAMANGRTVEIGSPRGDVVFDMFSLTGSAAALAANDQCRHEFLAR